MYVCMYIYIYIYIHTHTYIHTYIHRLCIFDLVWCTADQDVRNLVSVADMYSKYPKSIADISRTKSQLVGEK